MQSIGAPPSTFQPAERIGPYRLLQVLGEGGMGVVYEAEETGAVRRRVALKILKDRHASREVIARFEIERQALAVMNHPGVAKVVTAGETESGQPYFAMELVRGLPITQYCDEHRLSVRQRLELFIAVCQAVQHAHQKGLIHRDLKPSNILVTDADGTPQPKIIDFGIAKAVGQPLTEDTLVTLAGHAVGTVAYMSPEQAESSSAADVDTRADIYSLGVLLYELLVGRLPSDPAAVGIHVYLARLMARESDPPTPSTRLASGEIDTARLAKTRRTDATKLRRQLRGDLDWIVMKAMELDRSRRYATANGLATDIQRYLDDEPVVARPPSATYKLRKFVRRNRAGVALGTVALAAVIASAVFTTIGMVRARRAERQAAAEAAISRQVTQFMAGIFRLSGPNQARANEITAREVVDRAAEAITRDPVGDPALQAHLLYNLGRVYTAWGAYPEAERLLADALRLREASAGAADTGVAEIVHQLGVVASSASQYDKADSLLSRGLAIRRAAFGEAHPEVGTSLGSLALLRMRQRRLEDAESLYVRATAIHEAAPEPDRQAISRQLNGRAAVLMAQRRFAEAEPLMRRALAMQVTAYGPEHPDVAATSNNLGALYWMLGRFADALPLYEQSRRIYEKSYPPDHVDVASNLNNLGETYWKLRRYAEAEPLFRRALAIKEQKLPEQHPSIATTLNGLANVLRDGRRYAEAEPLFQRALAIRRSRFGPDDPATLETRRDYAALLRAVGRTDAADALTPP